MNPPPKSILKSRTAAAATLTAIAGACGTIWPDVNQFIASHASTILLVLGAVNFGLRLVSRGRVVLFAE